MGLLEGKVAIITGSGSGMGRAKAELFEKRRLNRSLIYQHFPNYITKKKWAN